MRSKHPDNFTVWNHCIINLRGKNHSHTPVCWKGMSMFMSLKKKKIHVFKRIQVAIKVQTSLELYGV